MSGSRLTVLLDGQPIGELRRLVGGRLELRYGAWYLSDLAAVPLSLSMPLSSVAHPDRAITPWLWGLLPDNPDVLRRWGAEFGVSPNSPFELLGTEIGYDCAGAVQFCAPQAVNWLTERGGDLRPLTEAAVAERLRALKEDETAWLDPRRRLQFSLAGGQRKTALYFADGEWGIPIGTLPTTHILKPSIRGLTWTEVNEHLCLSAARYLGIVAARTSLCRFEDQVAVVVERYDRLQGHGRLRRVHQEDFCQALGLHPSMKYQIDGGPGPSEVVTVLRRHVPAPDTQPDIERFIDALVFNWIIGAPDAHAKNYSLLVDQRGGRLAPLYDVISALPYNPGGRRPLRLAMRVGRHYSITDIRRRDWKETAERVRVDQALLTGRILGMADRLPGAFERAAAEDEVRDIAGGFADRLVEQMVGRAKVCSYALERPAPRRPLRGG